MFLQTIQDLAAASAAEQQRLRQEARSAFRQNPAPGNRLRLALALASDQQSRADLLRAGELLDELLTQTLPQGLTALLQWQRQQLHNQLQVLDELENLRQQLAEQKVSLLEAEAKLEALTSIEQTMEDTTPKAPLSE